MSSNEDEVNDADNTHKKRRIQRACDICRRKKIRCDGGQQPDNVCSNCSTYKFECTYVESAKKRGPPKGYVEALETRVERLDKLLRRLCPDENVYNEMNKALDTNQWTIERPPAHPSPLVGESSASGSNFRGSFLDQVASAIRHVGATVPPPTDDDDDEATLMLADNLKRLELEPLDYRFFGKSSGAMLIRTALELKDDYVGGAPWGNSELSDPLRLKASMKHLRPEFWVARPWEKKVTSMESPVYTFPEPDLARDLIDLYFRYVNLYQPLLHRPTFMKWVDEEMYLKNASFAPVYLLVCAVGARWSDDPRCLLAGYDSYHSCGWKWFDQVQLIRRSILSPPTLFDLQVYVLSIQFLQGSSAPQSCWTMVGIGIRLAQDVGAHRRKANGQPNTPEDEMWRRAFWVLVSIDRAVSSSLGRPCAIQDEDFDLEMPADCDDEYWEHPDPEKRFKQPPGKPSLITAFILSLSLNQILAFSLRTIYSINKSKVLLGFIGQPWEETIVTELDSALNKWVDSIPDHLRWDPNRKDDDFFNQSVSLYTSYYHVQILIHRPFIPSPSKPSSLKFPSLAICTNAARICSHIVDIQGKRNSKPPPQTMMAVFTSAIVLLLSMWGGKRSGFTTDHNTGMADVQKCMKMLGMSEKRWHSAGRLWDIVYELAAVGDLPLPQPSPPTSNKRERNADEPISSASATDASRGATPPDQQPSVRVMASNSRLGKDPSVSADQFSVSSQSPDPHGSTPSPLQRSSGSRSRKPSQTHLHVEQAGGSMPPPPQYYALPVYSDDLGRLPIHGQLSFTPQGQTHLKTPQLPHKPTYMWPTTAPESANSGEGSSGGPSLSQASMGYPHQAGIPPHAGHFAPRYNQVAGLSPMAQGSPQGYGVDGALSAGMMFDTLSYAHSPQSQQQERQQHQQHPQAHLYGIGPMGPAGLMPGSMQSPQGFTPSAVEGLVERQHQQQQAIGQQQTMGDVGFSEFVDNDTMAMWTNAPTGFELNEWGTYLNNVSELTQHAPGTMNTGHQQQPHLRQQ